MNQNIVHDKKSDQKTAKNQGPIDQGDVNQIRNLSKEAGQFQSSNRDFMEPKSKTEGKKRGPYKKAQTSSTPQNHENTTNLPPQNPQNLGQDPLPLGIPGAQAVKPLFELLSSTLVRTTGTEMAKLHPEEIQSLSDVWGMVLDRRSGQFIKENGDIIAAAAVTATVGFRLTKSLDEAIKIEKAKQAAKKPNLDNVTPITPDNPISP